MRGFLRFVSGMWGITLCAVLTVGAWGSSDTPITDEAAQSPPEPVDLSPVAKAVSGLKFRLVGPAIMSGRIGDFAVDPNNHSRFFVAACSGGVWKTNNAGTTWKPVFDGEGSYSIGCVEIDPTNTNIVWVGTGENNSQRSVGFGDGVYKSVDGGKSWKNMGLGDSEHIGMIAIHPRNGDIVYVAAQGPLWRSGGDRGLYQTTDGGATWNRILHIGDDTGINEIHMDPRNPKILYASAYQRRRHVWTQINGGPGSAIHKSEDGGATWRKINKGLPGGDLGRIGMDISPADPDVLYAIVQAAQRKGGLYRSTDRGETWVRRNDYMTTSPQYYNELVCDPHDVDVVYALDTVMHRTEDGGKTMNRVPRTRKHVDNHALWIDPEDTSHLLVGCDGGIYESFDRGANWAYTPNLPLTQFYRIHADNSEPFYYIYGGTQDNSSFGAPSRTTDRDGITNEDWFLTVGGDGYETQVDPIDPDTVYSQWQYGGLVRYDRKSGERVDIKPREKPGEDPLRWNWDSPLLISPHLHTRIYFASQVLYRSDDRGNSWQAISGDLSRQLDRDQLEVMGKIQNVDAVAKNWSTSPFGNIVALTESPLVEGLIYVGTDDGLVQVTEDGGVNWRKIALFPGIPDMTYVSCILASLHDPDTVFAAFDNHKNGDFAPYLLKSMDRGENWESITADLPERDVVYTIAQDHVREDLLFVGTEFGAYFTLNSGEQWHRLKSGLPTIAVRDIDIQERENDLVLGTFGRSIYILDDYTPLRLASPEMLEPDVYVFPIRDALSYIQTGKGRGSLGATFFTAANPPYGAVITYHVNKKLSTRLEDRKEAEGRAEKAGDTPPYPTWDELRAEEEEREPTYVLTIRNEAGDLVRRFAGSRSEGLHRTAWDLRWFGTGPIEADPNAKGSPWSSTSAGPLVVPGTYTVSFSRVVDGAYVDLTEPMPFVVKSLNLGTFATDDPAGKLEFEMRASRLYGAIQASMRCLGDARTRVASMRKATLETPDADPALLVRLEALDAELRDLSIVLRGDRTKSRREEPTDLAISRRVSIAVSGSRNVTSAPTQTQRDQYGYAAEAFETVLATLQRILETDLPELEATLGEAGAPWTPGRLPEWTP